MNRIQWFLLAFLGLGVLVGWIFYLESIKILAWKPTAWERDQRADCAVVLTGWHGRVAEGFSLLAQGRIQKLIISGVNPSSQLREIFPQWPYYGRLKEENVILEKRSRTTYGNAQQSMALVEALRCRDVILVTSHLHMYRALRIFKAVFPEGYPLYPRAIVSGRYHHRLSDLVVEIMKSLFYSVWAF